MTVGKNMPSSVHALVLAAGKGTRMGADTPKVLVPAAGRPLLGWVLEHLRQAGVERRLVVVGYGRDEVIAALPAGVTWVEQTEQLGTGHAVMCAREELAPLGGTTLVTCGDMPLIRPATYAALLDHHRRSGAAGTVLTARLAPPHRYGRVLRDADGAVERIVEAADATPEELAVDEINTGVYAFRTDPLLAVLDRLGSDNEQGEYYLPDVLALLLAAGERVAALACETADEAHGVNTPEDLARVEALLAGASAPGEG
jgi:UDP-N-acetylglucosamine diphosphorylase/glucosamine-1-phosphate N-acetyltransferase